MPLHLDGQNIGQVFYGATPIREVYYGSTLVWRSFDSSWQVAGLSKTITVPDGAVFMDIIALGGGGGGVGSDGQITGVTRSSGWAGKFAATMWPVTAGQSATITIGAGGIGGEATASVPAKNGKAGGDTTVSMTGKTTLTAPGGVGVSSSTNAASPYYYRHTDLDGEIPGDFTYTLGGSPHTVTGGTPPAPKNTDGPWPGGGGGGFQGGFMQGGTGRPGGSGCVWYRFRSY